MDFSNPPIFSLSIVSGSEANTGGLRCCLSSQISNEVHPSTFYPVKIALYDISVIIT